MKKNTIIVLGKPYSIEYRAMDDAGFLEHNIQKIYVNNTHGVDQQAETLLHEVLHAISNELRLDLPEKTVARLAVGIYSAGYRLKEKM